MLPEPTPSTEYTLVRTVDSRLHVATFIRNLDNSGSIHHGEYGETWEFNREGLLDSWRLLFDVGWVIENSIANGDVGRVNRPTCGCPWFDAEKLFELQQAGLATAELNRQWRDYCRPITEFHDRILWGG